MSINEKLVYEIWKDGKFEKELKLDNSEKIEIVDPVPTIKIQPDLIFLMPGLNLVILLISVI